MTSTDSPSLSGIAWIAGSVSNTLAETAAAVRATATPIAAAKSSSPSAVEHTARTVLVPLRDRHAGQSEVQSSRGRHALLAASAAASLAVYLWYRHRANSTSDQRQRQRQRPPYEVDLSGNRAYQLALRKSVHDPAPASAATIGATAGSLLRSGGRWLRAATIEAIAGAAAVADTTHLGNEVVLEITEFVQIPDHVAVNMVELDLPVRGEVRIHTFVDHTLRASLRFSRGRSSAAGSRTASFSGSVSGAINGLPAQSTLHDIVDDVVAETGILRFIPGRAESYLLMTYDDTTVDQIQPSVMCRECTVLPDSTPNQFRLRVTLEVARPTLDVCVSVALPKRAELRGAPELSCGVWGRTDGGTKNEYQWHVGDIGFVSPSNGAAAAGEGGALGDAVDSVAVDVDSSLSEARPRELSCDWVYYMPMDPHTADLSFRSAPNTPGGRRAAAAARRQFPGDSEDEDRQSAAASRTSRITDDFSDIPSVSTSYAVKQAATGLKAKRLGLELCQDDGSWVPLSAAADVAVNTSASYRTMYSQMLTVQVE